MKEVEKSENGDMIENRLCNKCGNTCRSDDAIEVGKRCDFDATQDFYGLINAKVRGGYFSPHLFDLVLYKFDICEKCLKEYFDSFVIPADEFHYDPWPYPCQETY